MEKGRISMDELSQKLVASRKIMKKVDSGDFEKGNINENMLKAPEELMGDTTPSTPQVNRSIHRAPQTANPDKIRESKLPDAIKQAMIDSPIQQIGLDSTLDMNFVEKTRRLMENDGYVTPKKTTQSQQQTREVQSESKTEKISSSELERRLTPIIENVIRKTLDEIVDRKLNQILSASFNQSINENLAIKVGDTIFSGKITKAKSVK